MPRRKKKVHKRKQNGVDVPETFENGAAKIESTTTTNEEEIISAITNDPQQLIIAEDPSFYKVYIKHK